jgi:hypothetical protein
VGAPVTTVHLIRDYENRHGKMYCGFEGKSSLYQNEPFLVFILDTGNQMLVTTAMCEVTCERCQKAVRKLRKARGRV